MKRIINAGKEFCTYVKTPLIADDVHAYSIVWNIGKGAEGAGLIINARRSDGVTVTDYGNVDSFGVGEYTLAANMYSVTGSLEVRLGIVSENTTLTEKILMFDVIRGNGNESIESEDNLPLLTTVLSKASEAVAKAENIPEKVSQLENDCGFISAVENENIANGAVTPEKVTFYNEINSLSKQAFLKTAEIATDNIINDKIGGSVIEKIILDGNSFQNNSVIKYENKTIVSENLTVECKRDGRMILNGTLGAGEEVIIGIPSVTFYEACTYTSKITLSDESKRNTFFVFAENFSDGTQSSDTVSDVIKIVQGDQSGEYDNFELCYTIFEEERSGKNSYPVYCVNNINVKLSGKNRISYKDVFSSGYSDVEYKENGIVLEGRYYALLSENFINRLEKGKDYTFSCKRNYVEGSGSSNVPRIAVNYEDGTSTQWTPAKPTAHLSDKNITSATLFFSGTANVKCQIADLMLEEGIEATEYEEFVDDAIISLPDVNLYKIGNIADKLIIGKEICVEKYICSSEIDETKDLTTQKSLASLFPEKTVMSTNSSFGAFKGKTVKIKLNPEAEGVNYVVYYSSEQHI